MSTKKTILAAALAASLAASAVVRAEVEGRYRMEIFKADASGAEVEGSRRVAADWFENIITNNGLDFLGGGGGNDFGANVLVACRVGTGSTPAAETDNALVSHLAGTSTVNLTEQGANSVSPYYGWKRRTFRFALGAVVGNVSEVSVWTALTGGTMFSRALVESGGAPTTITILADEQLDVVYEARAYAQVGDLAWGRSPSLVWTTAEPSAQRGQRTPVVARARTTGGQAARAPPGSCGLLTRSLGTHMGCSLPKL